MTRELASGVRLKRDLSPVVPEPGKLARHPDDNFRLADPYPMGRASLRVLRALIMALCPPRPAPSSEALLGRVEVGARRFMRYMHPVVARGLVVGLFIIDFLPLFTLKSVCRLHRLDHERARSFVYRIARSRIRPLAALLGAIRSLVLSLYFDQTEVHDAIGYYPLQFQRHKVARRLELLDGPATAAAD